MIILLIILIMMMLIILMMMILIMIIIIIIAAAILAEIGKSDRSGTSQDALKAAAKNDAIGVVMITCWPHLRSAIGMLPESFGQSAASTYIVSPKKTP